MNVIYVSCLISKKAYNHLFYNSLEKPGQQVQKYHRLLAEGFTHNGVRVTTVSAAPITRNNCMKILVILKPETLDGVHYTYLTTLNIPILKNLWTVIHSFFSTAKTYLKNKNSVVVCDILNISVSTGALLASKLFKVKSIGIVTDVPDMLALNPKKWSVKFNNRILSSFSEYVFLTEQMNNLINKKRKPYVVIEGQVDINMQHVENRLEDKYPQKVSIYAGMIQKKYGINTLVEAFLIAAQNGEELHIYGSGDYEEELKEICKKHTNIRYFGVVPNDVVVKEEIKATLLINPRPTYEEFTKYSFPSKNMEYMVSGTPVLTTKLSGMPEEYYPYVYLINDEIIDGLSKTLKDILTKNSLELYEKGSKAKEFVLKEKNNVVQAGKILEMMNTLT